MIERRKERRRRSLLGGTVSFNHGRAVFDCAIRNVSSTGAMIALPNPVLLPAEFDLHIGLWRESFSARTIWRESERVGITLSEFVPVTISLEQVRRTKALQKENRQLRALLFPPS